MVDFGEDKWWDLATVEGETGDGIRRVVCALIGEMFIPVVGVKK